MFPLASNQQSKTYVEDVFSAYTYTGNGATQAITNGIDLAGKGGMVWRKDRGAGSHYLRDSTRGSFSLITNSTNAQAADPDITGFTSSGFSVGNTNGTANANGSNYVSWTFRNAYNFFQVLSVIKTAGSNKVIDLSPYMATVGMVKVKRTDSTGSWYVWHRSLTAGKLLIGETTAAETTLGHITVSGTTLTLVDGVIADGTYHIEAYAHDTSADGMIQCGSFTTDGSGNATVTLGWETQFVDFKGSTVGSNWNIVDGMRKFCVGPSDLVLQANTSNADQSLDYVEPTATGMKFSSLSASQTYIYLAIRRGPMKPPTSGTQVYNAIARTGTGGTASITGVGFPPDLIIPKERNLSIAKGHAFIDRLRGAGQYLLSAFTNAEAADATTVTSFEMDGVKIGGDNAGIINYNSSNTYINHFFRRYPGVFDYFADTGTGANKTETHGLTVAPKFWFRKSRSGATQWVFGSMLLAATEKIVSPSPAGKVTDATAWNSTYPTATAFSVGTAAAVNTSLATYITYLVGELAGISKVFGYTGDGTTGKLIDCGFASGARFILIVRTDATGSFWIFDTTRGIVAGSDPALALDTTAAEVTTVDAIDPSSVGFLVNQESTLNLNVLNATYIGFAIS